MQIQIPRPPVLQTPENFIQKLERLKRERLAREAAEAAPAAPSLPSMLPSPPSEVSAAEVSAAPAAPTTAVRSGQYSGNITLNEQQTEFVRQGMDFKRPFVVAIGSAGTGKTTMLQEYILQLSRVLPQYGEVHKTLSTRAPAVAVCSYTNKGVKNLRRALSVVGMQSVCLTIHKLLEYSPDWYTEMDENGEMVEKMRFAPARTRLNPLTGLKVIVIDEAGLCALNLYEELRDAAPRDCRFVFLGDIYQLPPPYNPAILGFKMVEALQQASSPLVELTQVYRQALDSPILRFALEVKAGFCAEFKEMHCKKARVWESPTGSGTLKVLPIAETSDNAEFLSNKFGDIFRKNYLDGKYDPENSVILLPHGKPHTFGSHSMGVQIASAISDRKELDVYEVYSGFNKLYLCVGDRVTTGPIEGRITAITRNGKYYGKFPRPASKALTRTGQVKLGMSAIRAEDLNMGGSDDAPHKFSLADMDAFMEQGRLEDRKAQASHVVEVQLDDSEEKITFSTASELNALSFSYASTCHKAQGAEWDHVYIILHHVHANMFSREWLYTAMTRARKTCTILCRPAALQKCVDRAQVRGITLAEKAEFFKGKISEAEARRFVAEEAQRAG